MVLKYNGDLVNHIMDSFLFQINFIMCPHIAKTSCDLISSNFQILILFVPSSVSVTKPSSEFNNNIPTQHL